MYNPTKPFPHRLPNGSIILDEECSCGHRRTAHASTVAFGHGHCFVTKCECIKFSWTAHVMMAAT
jgi:hypothetical protein